MSQDIFTETYTAVNYCDWITPKSAEVKAGYDEWHLLSMAAVTRNSFGKGKGWYVGTIAKEEKFYDELMSSVIKDAGIDAYKGLPVGVEAIYRTGNNKTLLFLINHTEEPKNVPVPSGKTELITGKKTQGTLELGIYGVAVIEL
jgi:beta-galactosidase